MRNLSTTEITFEQIFPLGNPNDACAQYFTGNSYNTLPTERSVPVANISFESGCRNNWHIHHGTNGGGDQILFHAGNTPTELIDYCRAKGILVEAYSPIAHGAILNNMNVASIAERYGVPVPRLCIRYTIQLGTVSLPKTANPDHMRANADLDFTISDEDMQRLGNLDEKDYGENAAFPVYSGK